MRLIQKYLIVYFGALRSNKKYFLEPRSSFSLSNNNKIQIMAFLFDRLVCIVLERVFAPLELSSFFLFFLFDHS